MATINVSTTAALTSALKSAVSGDVIKLAAGTYSGFGASNLTFTNGVTITSADPAKQAILTDFSITNVHGVTFSNLEMVATTHLDYIANNTNYYAFKVAKSSDIHFDKIYAHGSLDGNAQNDVLGLQIRDSSNVSVTNSEFEQLNRALAVGNTKDVVVSGNEVHGLRSDGFNFAQVSKVKVTGNVFHDFDPVKGDHPDAIQFWTTSTTVASSDILISGNVITRGDGEYTQGIFMRDETGVLPYERVTISDNLIVGTGWSGLRVIGAKNLTITNNELVSVTGDYTTYMLIQKADGVVATGNSSARISFDEVKNLTDRGNVITKTVADLGLSDVKDWAASHNLTGSMAADLKSAVDGLQAAVAARPPPPIDEHLVGTTKSNLLEGFVGNDTLEGMGGTDTLSGGVGDDVYLMPTMNSSIIENAGEGQDTIIAVGAFVLPMNVETLIVFEDGKGWKGSGNSQDNRLVGNTGGNLFDGAAGNDTLEGGAGNDTLIGGTGSDVLMGGAGDDVFRFTPGGGKDTITDFGSGPGSEMIDVSAYLKLGLTPKVVDMSGGAVISFTNGDSITLTGVHAADLGAVSKYGWVV